MKALGSFTGYNLVQVRDPCFQLSFQAKSKGRVLNRKVNHTREGKVLVSKVRFPSSIMGVRL